MSNKQLTGLRDSMESIDSQGQEVPRPQTQASVGRRIYERKFYVTQHDSNFQTSQKIYTNVKTDDTKQGNSRPNLNGYKREFSMPDYLYIEPVKAG